MGDDLVLKENIALTDQLDWAFRNGVDTVCLFFEVCEGKIPRNKPKLLQDAIMAQVPSHRYITSLKFTRTQKLLVETNNLDCAKELAGMTSILGAPVSAYVQAENITSRFALHNIDIEIPLVDLGTELQLSNNFKVTELRRFTRRVDGTVRPTETILVTVLGTHLPDAARFFYMSERIRPFYDRPRQCSKCWRFDHVFSNCKYDISCRKCSGSHLQASCENGTPRCANCHGAHEATDPDCPSRLKEMKLLKFKADNHIPITEARRRFRAMENTKTYAAAVTTHAASPPSVSCTPDMDSMFSDFLRTAQEALQQLLQQQLAVFQQQLSQLIQQQLAVAMQTITSSLPPLLRETSLASLSPKPTPPASKSSIESVLKRARLTSSATTQHWTLGDMSVDSG